MAVEVAEGGPGGIGVLRHPRSFMGLGLASYSEAGSGWQEPRSCRGSPFDSSEDVIEVRTSVKQGMADWSTWSSTRARTLGKWIG